MLDIKQNVNHALQLYYVKQGTLSNLLYIHFIAHWIAYPFFPICYPIENRIILSAIQFVLSVILFAFYNVF